MTNKLVWLMPVTALAVSAVVVSGSMAASIRHPSPSAQEATTVTVTTAGTTNARYVLRIWEGRLGMFRGDSETPYRELDMPLSLLSDYDRELLTQGIITDTEEEMRALVEDITS
ncbi:MAG: hypothetical protein IJY74_00195 [Oscillospiraceae bacterium]|nr:hypothetical protein [Oscillospiraceae bacterium]